MEYVLTPLVTRFLRHYVKRSAEGAGRDLKVSFSRGNVLTLHNLELNLAPLLGGAASLVHVRRAFARRLSITIPWTALTTQPIQVVLDTVELVLSAAEPRFGPTLVPSTTALDGGGSEQSLEETEEQASVVAVAAAATAAGGGGSGGGGWFGSALQSMALRAGLNVTVKLSNVVAKWVQDGEFVTAITFQQLLMQTSEDDWADGLQNPDAWLKKECSIRQLSISLDQHQSTPGMPMADLSVSAFGSSSSLDSTGGAGGTGLPPRPLPAPPAGSGPTSHNYQSLLRIARLGASALLPAFAWLEGADLAGDAFNTSVEVRVSPLHVAVNDRQLRWSGILVAVMKAAAAAKAMAAAHKEAAAADAVQTSATPESAATTPSTSVQPTPGAMPAGTPITGAAGQAVDASPLTSPRASVLASRPQVKALGVFGRVWGFLIDEAAYVESGDTTPPQGGTPRSNTAGSPLMAAPPHSPPALQQPAVPMYAELRVVLEQVHAVLGVVEDRQQQQQQQQQHYEHKQLPHLRTQLSEGGTAAVAAGREPALPPDLEATLEQLRKATAHNSLAEAAALQHQLAAALAASSPAEAGGAAAQQGQAHHAAFEVHQFAELHLQDLKVALASVDASISGGAVEVHQCSLRRSMAASQLVSQLLAASETPAGGTGAGEGLAKSRSVASLQRMEADRQALVGGAVAAGSSSWVEGQGVQQAAVTVRYFDTTAAPDGRPRGSASKPPGAGTLRCSAVVGRLLVAHAPGFATNLLLFIGQYSASGGQYPAPAAAAGALQGSTGSLSTAAGGANKSSIPVKLPTAGSSPARSTAEQPDKQAATGSSSSSPSLLAQALQPQLLLECRVAQVELVALSSQAAEAAAVLLRLHQLELRSGTLNWDAPWNSHLRHALLAPSHGFVGQGVRVGLGSAMLAVADSTVMAEAEGIGDCSGLWQLRHASGVSSRVHLDAVVTAATAAAAPRASSSGGKGSADGLLVSAALDPLHMQLSEQQVAAVAAVVDAIATEAGNRFQVPLLPEEQGLGAQQEVTSAPWLSSCTLGLHGGIQMAYAVAGGLQRWRDPHGVGIAPAATTGGSSSTSAAEMYLGLGGITAAVTASPAEPGLQGQQHVLLQAQVVQPHAWLLPSLAVQLPAAEARLGLASPDHTSTAMLPEPLLLLAGLGYCRHQQQCSVQLSSVSLAVGAADYPLLAALMACCQQRPTLPPRPKLLPASGAEQPLEQPTAPVAAASLQEAGGWEEDAGEAVESGLLVQVDAASLTIWPQPLQQQQQQGQGQEAAAQQLPGLAVWLRQLQLNMQELEGDSVRNTSTELSLAAAHAALVRRRLPAGGANGAAASGDASGTPLELSPVLCFPAMEERWHAQLGQQEVEQLWRQPALMLTLSSSSSSSRDSGRLSPSKGLGSGGRRLQLHAAPIDLAVSRELLAAVATISSDLGGSGVTQKEGQPQQPSDTGPPRGSAAAAAQQEPEPESLQGKAALQGVRLLLLEAAHWSGDEREDGGEGQPALPLQPRCFERPAAADAAAVEVEIVETVVLLQQVPAAENRPWLAVNRTAAAALITSADASLIGASITVWHAGPDGADATTVLPPTDGRLQLLLQPHTGAVGVALHVQLLPLQASLPAVAAVSTVVSTLSQGNGDRQQGQQAAAVRAAAPTSPRPPQPSAAVVAGAANVIIEDASANLDPQCAAAAGAFALAGPRAQAVAAGAAGTSTVPGSDGLQEQDQQWPTDDLAGALFTVVHSHDSSTRPTPLQVQTISGDSSDRRNGSGKAVGLGAQLWGGGGRQEAGTGQQLQRQGIRWCYPHAREVALLVIEAAPTVLLAAAFQLSFFSAEQEGYVEVPMHSVTLESISAAHELTAAAGSGKTLVLIVESVAAATEWEVCWELPPAAIATAPAAIAAAAMLHCLRINPRPCSRAVAAAVAGIRRRRRPLPPPLVAPLTLVLTAESSSLALLAPVPQLLVQGQQDHHHHAAAAAALLDTVAVLHAGSLKVAVHTYQSTPDCSQVAVDVGATLALCLPDSSTATAPPGTEGASVPGWAFIEPFELDGVVEISSGGEGGDRQLPPMMLEGVEAAGSPPVGESEGERQDQRQDQPLFWQAQQQQQELPLLAVRRPPRRRGLALLLAARQHPLVVNASEGGLADLNRLAAVLSGPLSSTNSSASGAEGSSKGGPEGKDAVAATPEAKATTAAAPLLLVNTSGLDLQLRQEGAPACQVLLRQGQRLSLVWPAPPALVPGATRRLQLAAANAAEGDEAAWSAPVDAMAAGGQQLLLPMAAGHGDSSSACCGLAVQVQPFSGHSGSWEVVLQPGMRAVNHMAVPVHFALASEGSSTRGSSGKALPQQPQTFELVSGSTSDLPVHGSDMLLRLWLGGVRVGGGGGGWSQAVLLPRQPRQHHAQPSQKHEPMLMVLFGSPAAAASATAAGLVPPAATAVQQQLGAVLAQLLPPDAGTGQASIHFWPPLLLHNKTPCPVRLLLPAAQGAVTSVPAADAALPQQPTGLQEAVLPPGASRQLMVPLQGGTVGTLLALEAPGSGSGSAAAAAVVAASAAATADAVGPGLVLVVPPLIADSADQQWFGSQPEGAAAALEAAPTEAVYIAPPGESTCLHLHLLLGGSATEEPAAAAAAAATFGSASRSLGLASGGMLLADCVLVTQQHTEELPLLQLLLLPALVVHNCLPSPLLFKVPGAAAVEVPAGVSLPLGAGSGGVAEEAVVLLPVDVSSSGSGKDGPAQSVEQAAALLLPQAPPTQRLLLRSQPFALSSENDSSCDGSTSSSSTHLVLTTPSPPAARSSSLWHTSTGSSAADASGGWGKLECRLGARVQVQHYLAAGGTVVAAAVAVTITAGCFVSNLTGLPLEMVAEAAGSQQAVISALPHASTVQSSLASSGNLSGVSESPVGEVGSGGDGGTGKLGMALPHAATLPLLHLWQADLGGAAAKKWQQLSHRHRSWGSTSEKLRSFSGGLLTPAPVHSQQQVGSSMPALRFALTAADGEPAPAGFPPAAGWSAPLWPFAAVGRQRLYLQQLPSNAALAASGAGGGGDQNSSVVMLTYRVLLSGGSFHLVLFRDRQPPFVIDNATAAAVDVGFFPPAEAPDGGFAYSTPLSAIRVGPGHTLECDFNSGRDRGGDSSSSHSDGMLSPKKGGGTGAPGGWDDQEDEDAFLDCLLQEELRAAGQEKQQPPPVLKFRAAAGGSAWHSPCVLLPGLHIAAAASREEEASKGEAAEDGLVGVHISKCGATTRILLLPGARADSTVATHAGAASEAAEAAALGVTDGGAAEQPQPLWIGMVCRQLQVCLWDDERQRLLPGMPAGSGGSSKALGRELFSFTVDSLHLELSRQLLLAAGVEAAVAAAGAGAGAGAGGQLPDRLLHPWQQQPLLVMSVHLTAVAVQVDSFLPGSEQPVLLTSIPNDSMGAVGSYGRRRGPAVQMVLEVHHCPPLPSSCGATAAAESMSFRNCWVHNLLIQLPTLAAAADDSLLHFLDRMSILLAAGTTGDATALDSGTSGLVVAGGAAQPLLQEAAAVVQQGLVAEAAGAAASRLYTEQAVVESVRLLLDAHITAGTAGVPVAVDTHHAPVTLSRIAAHNLLFRPHILVRGLMAHVVAEALLNAPQVLGSLSLLFNPTGLVQSVRAGVGDLIGLPLATLQNQSLVQFIAGVGMGSVSLVRHTLGALLFPAPCWTLTSISGFSQAFSRAVDSAVTVRGSGSAAAVHRPPPSHLAHGLTQGLAGLAEGVTAGITGVVRAPMQGYSSGSGLLGGIGRGLLGAVGLPVSGALELVGSLSAGLATSAGVVFVPQPRRTARLLLTTASGGDDVAPVLAAARLVQHPALLGHMLLAASSGRGGSSSSSGSIYGLGRYLVHVPLEATTVLQGAEGLHAAHFARGCALDRPLLLVTRFVAVLFSGGGLEAVLVLPLGMTDVDVRYSSREISLFSRQATPVGRPDAAAHAMVLCRMSREAWLRLAPLLCRTGGSH